MSCSPGRPVFGEDLPSSSGPPTPFRNLPTSSSSPPPFSPFKPCSRQSSSSDTDLSLTPKTGKNTLPIPLLHSHHSVLLTPTSGAAMVMVFVYFVYSYLIPCLFTLDFLFFVHFFFIVNFVVNVCLAIPCFPFVLSGLVYLSVLLYEKCICSVKMHQISVLAFPTLILWC